MLFRSRRRIRASLYASRALALLELRRADEAIAELEQAARLDPADAELAVWLADLHVLAGRTDDAARVLAAAGVPHAQWAPRYAALATARAAEGEPEQAAMFRRAENSFAEESPRNR